MMKKNQYQPSKWALAFFRWFCQPDLKEEIEGDLLERFNTYAHKNGLIKANRHFVKDVILLFRPTIIGNVYQLTNTEIMWNSKQNKRLLTILSVALGLLLVPFLAMKLSSEVNWRIFDFIVAAILLVGTGLVLELILRKIKTRKNRIFLGLVLFLALTLLWAELAVGVFDSPIAGH